MADYEFPDELLFTQDDEWIRVEGDSVVIGISDFAQNQLGDIVFVELPEVGSITEAGAAFGTIESVKAVSEIYSPVSGRVIARNEEAIEDPEIINNSPYESGWLVKVELSDTAELDKLMSSEQYDEFTKGQGP